MFEKIINEKCAIETRRLIEKTELRNKEIRERIIEFMSNLVGKQWKNIWESRVEIEYTEKHILLLQ